MVVVALACGTVAMGQELSRAAPGLPTVDGATILTEGKTPDAPQGFWDAVWHMPQGMGALLGSFFGLLGVAISALIGFYALRRAQRHNARLDRQRDERLRREEGMTLAAALRGEVVSLTQAAGFRKEIAAPLDNESSESGFPPINWEQMHFPKRHIYIANLTRLGLLGVQLAESVTGFYAYLDDAELSFTIPNIGLGSRAKTLKECVDKGNDLAAALERFVNAEPPPSSPQRSGDT